MIKNNKTNNNYDTNLLSISDSKNGCDIYLVPGYQGIKTTEDFLKVMQ